MTKAVETSSHAVSPLLGVGGVGVAVAAAAGAAAAAAADAALHEQLVAAEQALAAITGIKGIKNEIRLEPAVAAGEVRAAIDDAFARIVKTGKAAGFLTADEDLSRRSIEQGVTFMAVGLDVNLLARQTSALASRFKST